MRSRLFADISSAQKSFDAGTYRRAGHIVIAIKATEGQTYQFDRHRTWAISAHNCGVSVIHYHFARPDDHNSPAAEARNFIEQIRPVLKKGDWVALDYERFTGRGSDTDADWCNSFWNVVYNTIHMRCWLYASLSVLEGLVNSRRLKIKRFWDADWSGRSDYKAPPFWTIARQTSGDGQGPEPHSLPGIPGTCDVDRMSLRVFLKMGRH